jgi:hypothetical protein
MRAGAIGVQLERGMKWYSRLDPFVRARIIGGGQQGGSMSDMVPGSTLTRRLA